LIAGVLLFGIPYLACASAPGSRAGHVQVMSEFGTCRRGSIATSDRVSNPSPFSSESSGFEWIVVCSRLFGHLRNRPAAGRVQHRFDDIVVAGAAADAAFQLVASSNLSLWRCTISIADMIMLGVQQSHCGPRLLRKAACIGCSSSPLAMPPIVVTLEPVACPISAVQELTALPSIWTVRAPHCLVSQPK
jgi:hypothetical protein